MALLSSSPFTLTCESDFLVFGLQDGEQHMMPVRIVATLITVTVTSAWFSWRKIKRLSLFFAHWTSGLVMSLCYLFDETMIALCWTSRNLETFIKIIKFIELTASNMLAITSLAVCINLALIVQAHRTMIPVRSVSSPTIILKFLAISMAAAAAAIPFWEDIVVLGTGFWLINADQAKNNFIVVSVFYVEFFAGVCMLFIVTWLLLFRMEETKKCWRLYRGIRFYFGLTIIGTAVNLGLGICGTLDVLLDQSNPLLLTSSWIFRYIHIALDTCVLYGVLIESAVDERGDCAISESGSDALSSEI